jgi:hypothetical protein
MPPKHAALPATVHADNIIAVDGLPRRHSRLSLASGFSFRFPEVGERMMNGRDQRSKLISPALMTNKKARAKPWPFLDTGYNDSI